LGLVKTTYPVEWKHAMRLRDWLEKVPKGEVLETLYTMFGKDWFFGIMEINEIQGLFERAPKKGNYCVCWSDPDNSFVIYYIPQDKAAPKGKGDKKTIKANNKKETEKELYIEKLSAKNLKELNEAVTKAQQELKLGSPLPNKPARLTSLKIKEHFIVGQSGYAVDGKTNPNESKDKVVADISSTHYQFIL
jgi:hypothetical protein